MSNDSRVRMLVVDDEPRIANLVAMVARYEGWNAVTAGTGEAALREAATFEPDIVVLDLMLPDLEASPCSIGFGRRHLCPRGVSDGQGRHRGSRRRAHPGR